MRSSCKLHRWLGVMLTSGLLLVACSDGEGGGGIPIPDQDAGIGPCHGDMPDPTCEESCSGDGDCGSGFHCAGDGTCNAQCGDQGGCPATHECERSTGTCLARTGPCASADPPDGCGRDCTRNADCPFNPQPMLCLGSICTAECVPATHEGCDRNEVCRPDGFCVRGPRPDPDGGTQECGNLVAIVRDFRAWDDGDGHEDFENVNADEPDYGFGSGMPTWTAGEGPYLATELDSEGKPSYLLGESNSPENSIHGESGYRQWYRDVDGVNMRFEIPIPDQDPSADAFVFDNPEFFPIDGDGFGNQGNVHNYHFTTEIVATFEYEGGEVFTFRGDDDVLVFVNGKLALDIGGVHGVQEKTLDFDAIADWLEITPGNVYTFHLFHAERHTHASNFRFETSIACLMGTLG